MAHIAVQDGVPGIRSLAAYRPDTGKILYDLTQILLRGESTLSEGERELIATYVSSLNACMFCMKTHGAAAKYILGQVSDIVDKVISDYLSAPISDKMKSLLTIAECVQQDAKTVSEQEIANAKTHGATDREIHDAVLIASAFCMFNRYVDGLASLTPTDPKVYEEIGVRLGTIGYVPPVPQQ